MPTTQQQSSEKLAATLVALYAWAEQQLLAELARVLRQTPRTFEGALLALPRARRLVQAVLQPLAQATPLARRMIEAGTQEGRRSADRLVGSVRATIRLPRTLPGAGGAGGRVPPSGGKAVEPFGGEFFDLSMSHGERAAQAIRDDIVSELDDVRFRLTRLPDDIYKFIAPHGAIYQALENGVTPAQAQAMAWRVFVSQGVTGFTDVSGRDWSLSAYVEMAVRTAAVRAFNASHLARMHALNVHYFTVGDTGHPCPFCFPWQGKVLTDGVLPNPDIHVDATIAEATAAGLWHPNAILGNQAVQALGVVENGVKAWYSGPSVNVTCASGVKIAVSPNHPVLTATGWLPAKFLSEGMQVFSTADGHGRRPASTDEDLNEVVTRVEDVLDAVAAVGCRTTVPVAGDDLHRDGQWVEGEIDVVLADRDLLPVVEADRVEQSDEGALPRPDVQSKSSASFRAEQLRLLRVERSIAGPLPYFDASSLHAPLDRRAADADTPADVLAALAVEVSPDRIVNVELDWYEGHAFDLQTSTGAYIASYILVHNCRHTLLPVIPGITVLPEPQEWTDEMAEGYKLSQRQRRLEVEVRKAKARLDYALDPAERRKAAGEVRAAQARVREFVNATGFSRQSRREQLHMSDQKIKLPALR